MQLVTVPSNLWIYWIKRAYLSSHHWRHTRTHSTKNAKLISFTKIKASIRRAISTKPPSRSSATSYCRRSRTCSCPKIAYAKLSSAHRWILLPRCAGRTIKDGFRISREFMSRAEAPKWLNVFQLLPTWEKIRKQKKCRSSYMFLMASSATGNTSGTKFPSSKVLDSTKSKHTTLWMTLWISRCIKRTKLPLIPQVTCRLRQVMWLDLLTWALNSWSEVKLIIYLIIRVIYIHYYNHSASECWPKLSLPWCR